MGYIIKTDDNQLIVVDGGSSDSAIIVEDYLVQLGGKVDAWVITHPHEDHAGVLIEILKRKKIIITKILHSALNEEWVRLNEMKSYSFLVKKNKIIRKSEVLILDIKANDSFSIGDGVDLKVIGDRTNGLTLIQ
ncbi:MBL fold metallo-hydrolase [Thalassobellus suaedae]|uniref:MBL fold metallo-hydrolase n=1 Tax=Thalassobellus suaedae TaxID=3074124 RepID=A0ABY9Y6S3_9FLAO|nr:MBL fold metallo-hydrolase [Flavobacteriaceae bacterium HL-DH10]